MMTTLNIVNKSPFEKQTLMQCLERIPAGNSVLLIEDAVVAAVANTAFSEQLINAGKTVELYVLQPDLAARGFADSALLPEMKAVDYAGFVELVTKHERVHSWL